MKIKSKTTYAQTTYWTIEAETDTGKEIIATFIEFWDDNCAVPEYSFEVIEGGKNLTGEEIDELKKLAIEFEE